MSRNVKAWVAHANGGRPGTLSTRSRVFYMCGGTAKVYGPHDVDMLVWDTNSVGYEVPAITAWRQAGADEYEHDADAELEVACAVAGPYVPVGKELVETHMGLELVDALVTPENLELVRLAACPHLPADPKARKDVPLVAGLLDYFPDALMAVAALSKRATDQHHPGQPVHWERGKSDDHDECLMRHFLDRGTVDTDGQTHRAKVAWRALAALQLEIEADRAKV